jgi:hypothetical protein
MIEFEYTLAFTEQYTDFHQRDMYIDRKGVAYLINCYSADDFAGELGWYKWKIDKNFLDFLTHFIEMNNILNNKDYYFVEEPDSWVKTFTIEKGELKRSFEFDTNDSLPDIFMKLEEKYYDLIGKIKAFPWKTFRVSIFPKIETVFYGDYLEIEITFQNIGTSRICFSNPSSSYSGIVDFNLELTKKIITAEDISKGFFVSIDLSQTDMLISEREVLSSDMSILTLEQGESLNLKCRLRIPKCSPGEYAIKLIYSSVGNNEELENQEFIDGEVHTKDKTINIRGVRHDTTY